MSSIINNTPLSASRIKTLQTCSWMYYCKYVLKLPDTQNEGSLRGSCVHSVFEVLGNPRHKKHYNAIVKLQDISASRPVERMVCAFAKKVGIDSPENLELLNKMIIEGLNYDFFGEKIGKPTESISEKDFDIDVNEDGKNYRILGFIDKLFLFKRKKLALVRDFKTSKAVFSGDEIEDNMQNLMYCLAVKHLYPEFLKRKMEFLFLKFDCNKEGLIEMEQIHEDELQGFEFFLTEVQKTINNFTEEAAKSNLAFNMGYGKGFTGKVVCGRSTYKGQLKKDGTVMWSCPMKHPFDYYHLLGEDDKILASAFEKSELLEKQKVFLNSRIEKKKYSGCPAFNFSKKSLDNYDAFL